MENESSYDAKKEFERIESGKVYKERLRQMRDEYISRIRAGAQKKVMTELAKHKIQETMVYVGFFQNDTDPFLGSYNGDVGPKTRCDMAKQWLDEEFEKKDIPLYMRCALVDTDPMTYYMDVVRKQKKGSSE